MQSNTNFYSRSPPPLQHPIPTHPHYIPEPPDTPVSNSGNEPAGYARYSSPPVTQQHHVYGNVPGYAPQHQQQHQYQHFAGGPSGGRGTVPQQPGIPLPPMGMWGVNDATAQIGMQLGRSAVQAGHEYMEKNFGSSLPLPIIKHHFNVSNSYVLHKLKLVLFPWRHRPWSRQIKRSENGQTEGWQPPREDINAPDLYIPTMALVTYILLSALQTGLQSRFHPEILGVRASSALAVVLFEFMVIKLGCYFLNIQGQGQVTDLVAYGGYKFVGIILTIVAGLLKFKGALYVAVFIYAFCANAFFLLRSLRYVVLPDPATAPASAGVGNAHTVTQAQRGRRRQFLFAIAMSQVFYMGVLVRV